MDELVLSLKTIECYALFLLDSLIAIFSFLKSSIFPLFFSLLLILRRTIFKIQAKQALINNDSMHVITEFKEVSSTIQNIQGTCAIMPDFNIKKNDCFCLNSIYSEFLQKVM